MSASILTFKGGVHPQYNKELTNRLPIEVMPAPSEAVIPLSQHIGAPCEPLVAVGDEVKMGQKIGEAKGFVSVPVHSSVSGKVKAIEPRLHSSGQFVNSIVIENDRLDTLDESVKPEEDLNNLEPDDIKEIIKEAGIVGMGGATFPTHVKLTPPKGKKVDTVIINGAECEPYLTCDHRLMVEHPTEIVYGLKAILKVLGVDKGIIAIEVNKPDAIEAVEKATDGVKGVEVVRLAAKYPQGGEKQLINAVTDREVPSGGLPADVGVVVDNVGTVYAIARALKEGMPLIDRVVTITGQAVNNPKNLLVRIGTTLKDVVEFCGGMKGNPGKLVTGGPMMGVTQYTLDIPVIKGTSGVVLLPEDAAISEKVRACTQCGKCVEVCPMNLMPLFISMYALNDDFEDAEKYHALDCIECGCCSYICPCKRPLVESIRQAKREITAKRKKEA
jgi:electron transport complex protein RnfC